MARGMGDWRLGGVGWRGMGDLGERTRGGDGTRRGPMRTYAGVWGFRVVTARHGGGRNPPKYDIIRGN